VVPQDTFIDPLSPALAELADALKCRRDEAADEESRTELNALCVRSLVLAGTLKLLLGHEVAGHVYWAERMKSGAKLVSSPLFVAQDLKRLLFDTLSSVILTSATLTTGRGRDFSFFLERIGLSGGKTLCAGSPFDFRRNACVRIASTMPEPALALSFEAALPQAVLHYARLSKGRALVLFTSRALMKKTFEAVRGALEAEGIAVFCQGEGLPRTQLLQRVREDVSSVLFGTDSFWEGVDVQGEALENVIITRLPFRVPSHPLVKARHAKLEEEGRNPFYSYTLPEAVLRFKQGFGRLIRTKTDKGMVVVLDSRILSKSYGKLFLESLPDCPVVKDEMEF
jgi:ATP-dependent DNA helicase DinG